jgi:chromate reductase, NAD(P)H dehydrogenase (quinone)
MVATPAATSTAIHPAEEPMTDTRRDVRLLVMGASLGNRSLNNRLAALAARVVEEKGGAAERAEIGDFDCPLYDADLEVETGPPAGAHSFRERLEGVDGLIVSSPEYNASMPGVLKNLIDWVSRFRPQPFNGRQALLLSASPSMAGGNRGLWALRVPLEHLGMRVYPDMFSLAQAHQAFDEQGTIANATLQARFESTIDCFMDLVEAAKHYPALKKQWVEFLGEHPDAATDRVETSSADAA